MTTPTHVLTAITFLTAGFASTATSAESLREQFALKLVLPTYASLAEKAETLDDAIHLVVKSPTAEFVEAARQAWIAARTPWEISEAFLFGPVDTEGHDPLLDSWPLNLTDIRNVLRSRAALTPERLGSLGEGFTGFHAIEFFLFADDEGHPLSAEASADHLRSHPISLQYLGAASTQFRDQTQELLTAYDPATNGFVHEISAAGSGSGLYPAVESIGEEIALAMIGIVEEVRLAKLLEPVEANDPALLESRFSGTTLTDIQNNVQGVRQAFGIAIAPALSDQPKRAIEDALNELETSLRKIDPVALHREPESVAAPVQEAAEKAQLLQSLLESEVLANLPSIAKEM